MIVEDSQNNIFYQVVTKMTEGAYLIKVDDGTIVYTNPAFEKMFGYDSGELIGRHVSCVNAPTDISPIETARKVITEINKTGGWYGEVNNIKKDGTPFWCAASVSTFEHSEYGDVWIAVHTDITEQKITESATRASEQHLKLYRDQSPIATIEWNLDFQFVAWNKAAENLFGYTVDEVRGRDFAEVMLPRNEIIDVKKIWNDLISQVGGTLSVNENLTKSGKTILCEWHNTPLLDNAGKVIGAASLVIDITAKK